MIELCFVFNPYDKMNIQRCFTIVAVLVLLLCIDTPQVRSQTWQKTKDIVIYEDENYYSAFPSVVKRTDGTLMVAFRRAPERRLYGEKGVNHIDPNSYLTYVTSADGEVWSKEPSLIYAHPFGGSQDPCLLRLRNGELLCASYAWAYMKPDNIAALTKPAVIQSESTFIGGFLVRSVNDAKTWSEPIIPISVPTETNYDIKGNKLPAYNRGALCEGKNGTIYWAVASSDAEGLKLTSVHLLSSVDKGTTWDYCSKIASDTKASFNETSVYETPKGALIALLRTANMNDQACIARSTDGGKTFSQWESMGFQGHPINALRLPDNRVLLTYGYRHKPYGIRARILNAECTDFKTSREIVLREDGGGFDIGYTWPVMLDNNRVLVVYYYNINDGTRHIAGTILELK